MLNYMCTTLHLSPPIYKGGERKCNLIWFERTSLWLPTQLHSDHEGPGFLETEEVSNFALHKVVEAVSTCVSPVLLVVGHSLVVHSHRYRSSGFWHAVSVSETASLHAARKPVGVWQALFRIQNKVWLSLSPPTKKPGGTYELIFYCYIAFASLCSFFFLIFWQ